MILPAGDSPELDLLPEQSVDESNFLKMITIYCHDGDWFHREFLGTKK